MSVKNKLANIMAVKKKLANRYPRLTKFLVGVDSLGMWCLRQWFVMSVLTGIGAVWLFTQVAGMTKDLSSNPAIVIGGFVCTIWALLLAVFIYRFAAIDNQKGQADMTTLLAKVDELGDRVDRGPLLAKIDDLEKQVKELSSSTRFCGHYENYEGKQDRTAVTTHTGKNYVISLYGRPRFLLTRLLPF